MCLAISKPAGAVIPIDHLRAGHTGNPHGCGFCYSEGGKLFIEKGLWNFEQFYENYKKHEHCAMLIHFRFSTHGKPNQVNCHPFDVWEGRFAMIHNGMIQIHCSIPHLSDTGNFAKLILEPMLKAGIHPEKAAFRYLVETSIGDRNKVCLMAADGAVSIYNEEAGNCEDALDKDGNNITVIRDGKEETAQIWYSNTAYKYRRNRCNSRSRREDEYDGYYNCGQGEQVVTDEEAELIGGQGSNNEFTNRAHLDSPPAPDKVIQGFKTGVKQISDSDQVLKAYDAINYRSDGRYPSAANPTQMFQIHEIKEITSGPVFNAPLELEISFLQDKLHLSRGEAIHSLQLEIKDAISYV